MKTKRIKLGYTVRNSAQSSGPVRVEVSIGGQLAPQAQPIVLRPGQVYADRKRSTR